MPRKVEAAEGGFQFAQGLGVAARGAVGDDLGQQGRSGGRDEARLLPSRPPEPPVLWAACGPCERAPLGLYVPLFIEGFQIDPGLGRKASISGRFSKAKVV